MISSIEYKDSERKITVTLDDGTITVYANAESYIADHPSRSADCYIFSYVAPAVEPSIPQSVSAIQGLLAIDQQTGLASAYTAWASDSARTFAERAFIDKAQTWKRDDPTLMAAAAAFGLTSEQIDSLFVLANSL